MNYVRLAWSLAEACGYSLDETEKCVIYVALGSGDTRTATSKLVLAAAREHVALSTDTAAALRAWWAAHDGAAGTARLDGVLIDLFASDRDPRPSRKIPCLNVERKYLQANRTNSTFGDRSPVVIARGHIAAAESAAQT
jgi:hypothetical protein